MSVQLDLSQDLPTIDVKLSAEKTVTLTIEDLYDYAQIDALSGRSLKARIGKITDAFNQDHGTELTTDKMYLLMIKGMEMIEVHVGNVSRSST